MHQDRIRRGDRRAGTPRGAEAVRSVPGRTVMTGNDRAQRPVSVTGVYQNVSRGIVALVFHCVPESGSEQLSAESTAVAWLTPEEVSDRMAEVYAVRVVDALRGDLTPALRAHDGRHLLGG
ncbi:NUDIX hydrolase [Kitasatospora purpeofusca]|uniref:NUDIX hydrolase n=1 Tax=Kitasatospora purpeofusca TaxID=67352 RepID=UPI0039A4C376